LTSASLRRKALEAHGSDGKRSRTRDLVDGWLISLPYAGMIRIRFKGVSQAAAALGRGHP
jgi:hypothetical protein